MEPFSQACECQLDVRLTPSCHALHHHGQADTGSPSHGLLHSLRARISCAAVGAQPGATGRRRICRPDRNGTALLLLPVAVDSSAGLGLEDALFMSTSAMTITGLATIDVVALSLFGELVVLAGSANALRQP
jgi:hypothetical protein